MPKSITLGWKEYQELLNARATAEATVEELEELAESLKPQKRKPWPWEPVLGTAEYQKLYRAYTELRDRQLNVTMDDERARSRQMAAESEARARQAEHRANTLTEQLDTVTAQLESLTARNEALQELLTQARYWADDFSRRTRPNLKLPAWLSVEQVLESKRVAAEAGLTWTVHGGLQEED